MVLGVNEDLPLNCGYWYCTVSLLSILEICFHTMEEGLHLTICFFSSQHTHTHTHTHIHSYARIYMCLHTYTCTTCKQNSPTRIIFLNVYPSYALEILCQVRTTHLVCYILQGTCSIDVVILFFSSPPSFVHLLHHPTLSSNLFSSLHLLLHTFPVHRPTWKA